MIDREAARELEALLRAVNAARAVTEAARRVVASSKSPLATNAQRELLAALEVYVAALQRRDQPVPYRVRDELALYRAMFHQPLRPTTGDR